MLVKKHIVIETKAKDLQELLDYLDEKEWYVIDVEICKSFTFFVRIPLTYTVLCECEYDNEFEPEPIPPTEEEINAAVAD